MYDIAIKIWRDIYELFEFVNISLELYEMKIIEKSVFYISFFKTMIKLS